VSEILTGAYLRKNYETAVQKAKRVMGQMIWVNIDPIIAEKAGEINAYLIINGKKIEFQDVLIAATSIILNCDYLLTLNKAHFERIPSLEKNIFNPQEFKEKFSDTELLR
jgi:predicted nucleic acid-binding protein